MQLFYGRADYWNPKTEVLAKIDKKENMLNIQLIQGDILTDMAPTSASPHISPGGQPSIMLGTGNSLYSPGGAFRFTLQNDGNAVLQCVVDSTLPRKWTTGQPLNATFTDFVVFVTTAQTHDMGVFEVDMQADEISLRTAARARPFNQTLPGIQAHFSECRMTAIWLSIARPELCSGAPEPTQEENSLGNKKPLTTPSDVSKWPYRNRRAATRHD